MAERDEGTSFAAPGGEQVAAGMGDSGSYNARPPGGETPRTNAIVNAELQVEQVMGPPRQGAHSTGLTVGRFDGSNWFLWKTKVFARFQRLKLLPVVTGTEVAPVPGDAGYEDWMDKNAIAYEELILSFSDSVLDSVRTCANAREVWRKLVAKYESVSLWKRVQVLRDLNTRLTDGADMEKHVLKFNQTLDLLAATSKHGLDEGEKIVTFLCTLPPNYQGFITALGAGSEKELTLELVIEKVIQEDQQRRITSPAAGAQKGVTGTAYANTVGAAQGSPAKVSLNLGEPKQDKPQRIIPRCGFCNKKGHEEHRCFLKFPHLKPGMPKAIMPAEPTPTEDAPPVRAGAYMAFGVSSLLADESHRSSWLIDTGASRHLCCRRDWFMSLGRLDEDFAVKMGDDTSHLAAGIGNVALMTVVKGVRFEVILQDVLYMPTMACNLISAGILDEFFDMHISKGVFTVADSKGQLIGTASKTASNLYKLDEIVTQRGDVKGIEGAAYVAKQEDADLWHQRLGHLGAHNMQLLQHHRMVDGLHIPPNPKLRFCESCVLGKQSKDPFRKFGVRRASELLELVHTDLNGPMTEASLGGALYFMLVIDDLSRYTSVYFLKYKSDALKCMDVFRTYAERKTGKLLKNIRSDNGGEFTSKAFSLYCEQSGIVQQFTNAYTPEQNGVVERANRTIVDMSRAMMQEKGLTKGYWAEATATAVYLKNRSPHAALPSKTPFEAWNGHKPLVSHLRVFGCDAYALNPKQLRTKLDPRSKKYVSIGYCRGSKGYRLWDAEEECLYESRDVVFNESGGSTIGTGDYQRSNGLQNAGGVSAPDVPVLSPPSSQVDLRAVLPPLQIEGAERARETEVGSMEMQQTPTTQPEGDTSELQASLMENVQAQESLATQSGAEGVNPGTEGAGAGPQQLRRSGRPRQPPSEWWRFATPYAHVAYQGDSKTRPLTIASSDMHKWQAIVKSELKHITQTHYALPLDMESARCGLLYQMSAEEDLNGAPTRRIAEGYNYDEVLAPQADIKSVHVLSGFEAAEDVEVTPLDVRTIFQHVELEKETLMHKDQPPAGYSQTGSTGRVWICRLRESPCSLKQVSRYWPWSAKTNSNLKSLGYAKSVFDAGMYVHNAAHCLTLIALHVTSLFTYSEGLGLSEFSIVWSHRADLTELSVCGEYLRIPVSRVRANRDLCPSQDGSVMTLLTMFRITGRELIGLLPDHKLTTDSSPITPIERKIMAATLCFLSKLFDDAGRADLEVVKKTFMYLTGTIAFALVCTQSLLLTSVFGYSNAGDESNQDTSKGVSWLKLLIRGTTDTWRAKATFKISPLEDTYA